MNTEDVNDCANCQKYFVVKDGWNSEYCSKKCRDEALKEVEEKEEK